jgi:monoamine oxidase
MAWSAMSGVAPVVIVGGGLAGLHAARLLQREAQSFLLLEARARLGGRILSVGQDGLPAQDGFDLGPAWFWPEMQPELAAVVEELGLPFFQQHETGDIVVQSRPGEYPQRYRGGSPQQSPSARIAGGMGALIAALAAGLSRGRLQVERTVRRISWTANGCSLECTDGLGNVTVIEASRVILALPPRLIAKTIVFDPPLDSAMTEACVRTPTWMAPHAKFLAVYDRPFWREMGLSGTGRSMIGPLVEIHDATTAAGQAALFGFVGVPSNGRAEAGEGAVVAAAVEQLNSMYGPPAGRPIATLYKDWAADPLTATSEDLQSLGHPGGFTSATVGGDWSGRLFLAGSEASARHPGYLAGAVDAAERAVSELIAVRDADGVRVRGDEERI